MPGQGLKTSAVSHSVAKLEGRKPSAVLLPQRAKPAVSDSGGETPRFVENEMLKFKFAIDLK